MNFGVMYEGGELDAGGFRTWLAEIDGAIRGDNGSNVPCGTCSACCSAAQFIHIAPDEADALAHIPKQLLFPAPRLPKGHLLMGYDENGRCPMLRDGACSIYAHRPQACRAYDCRVFAAAGRFPDEPAKAGVAARARRWRFTYDGEEDLALHAAVRAAAEHAAASADLPHDATPVALRALRTRGDFA
jgi:Fe-S-cluster containining protein